MIGMYVVVEYSADHQEIYEDVVHVVFEFPNIARISREGQEDEFIDINHHASVAVMPRG